MQNHTRRSFLKSTGAGLAASSVPYLAGLTAGASPNERIRHAVIGTGGQGRGHCRAFSELDNLCEVVAVCDVDPENRARAAKEVSERSKPAEVEDYRRILDDKEIDTVSVATPDHWHAKVAIEAVLAGKHVYVEKPCCHNIREGQLLAEAASRHGKCVQHGTQSRSGEGIIEAIHFMRDGNLGKVRLAKAINHQLRRPIGRAPATEPPSGVNYDVWLGPAPRTRYTENRWHYNWHWFWDYGTGDIGNDGIHQVDAARWGLGVDFPNAVSAAGGQLFYDDDHETPDTQIVTYEYADCYLVYEMRLWTDYKLEGHDNGVVFYGDKGKLEVGRKGCFVTFIGEEPKKIGGGSDFQRNIRNFVECAKANDPSRLNAPVSEGFPSAALCHLGNIGTRLGRKLQYDKQRHRFVGDTEADALLTREYRQGYALPDIG